MDGNVRNFWKTHKLFAKIFSALYIMVFPFILFICILLAVLKGLKQTAILINEEIIDAPGVFMIALRVLFMRLNEEE